MFAPTARQTAMEAEMKYVSKNERVTWERGRKAITFFVPLAEYEIFRQLSVKLHEPFRGMIRRLLIEEGERHGLVPKYREHEVEEVLRQADQDIAAIEDCLARHPAVGQEVSDERAD